MYAGFAIWTAVTLLTACWLVIAHMGYSDYSPAWMTLLLRTSARATSTALWVPLVINLLAPFHCSTTAKAVWMGTDVACWSGVHIAMVISSAILLPALLAWTLLLSLTLIDRVPDYSGKKNLLAASHGRVDAAMLLLKLFLSAFFVFALDSINSWGFLLVCLAAGLAWVRLYITYLPYHHPSLNGMQVAAATVFTSACVCALISVGMGRAGGGPQAGAIAFLLFLPVVVYTGWSLMAARTRTLVTGKTASGHDLDLNSPYAVDVRVRCLLVDAISVGLEPRVMGTSTGTSTGSSEGMGTGMTGAAAGSFTVDFGALGAGMTRPSSANRYGYAAVRSSDLDPNNGEGARGKAEEEDFAAVQVRNTCADIWSHGSRSFGNSAMLHLFWAGYQAAVTRNAHLERLRLREAVDKADWSQVDIHFFAWRSVTSCLILYACAPDPVPLPPRCSRLLDIERSEQSDGASKMNVERRLRFEKMQSSSRSCVIIARSNVLNFWSELSNKHPDLQKMKGLGLAINSSLYSANQTFKELLELAPQNATIMRSYADFLLELSNDPRKAQELLTDAEQIEDDASKAHAVAQANNIQFSALVSDFDLSADSVALMKVSSESGKLGSIKHVNGQACKLFGYSRREMMAKTLSELIPQPIGAVHNTLMSTFLSTGSMRFIGVPRVSFILHRAGHIVPVKMNIRASSDGFAAVIDTMQTRPGDMYVWCLGEQAGWRITAACETAMGALGVDLPSLKAGSMTLRRFVPDVTVIESALAGSPPTVELTNTAVDNSGAGPSRASRSGLVVLLQAQCYTWRAVGQPVYMLRLKRTGADTAAQRLAKKRSAVHDDSSGSEGEEEDSDGGTGSGGVDRDAALGSDSEDGDDLLGVRPRMKASAKKGIHPSLSGDIPACPVMGGGSSRKGSKSSKDDRASTSDGASSGGTKGGHSAHASEPAASAAISSSTGNPVAPRSSFRVPGAVRVSSRSPPTGHAQRKSSKDPVVTPGGDGKEEEGRGLARKPGRSASFLLPDTQGRGAILVGKGGPHVQDEEEDRHSVISREGSAAISASGPAKYGPRPGSFRKAGAGAFLASALKKPGHVGASIVLTATSARTGTGGEESAAGPGGAAQERGSARGARRGSHSSAQQEDEVGKKAGSVLSGGSKSHGKSSHGSGTSATSVTEVLRRGVNAKAGKLETSLKLTRWAVVLVFVITAALNVISLLVTRSLMNQLTANIVIVFKNGRRAVLAQRLYSNVQAWVMGQAGLADAPNMTLEGSRNDVYINQLNELNMFLYSKVDGSLPEEKALYTDGSALTVHDLDPGQAASLELVDFTYTNRTVNLANAVIEFVSRMRRILQLNASAIQYSHPDVYWIVDTGSNALRMGMNASLMYADRRSQFQGGLIDLADRVVLIVSEVTFLLIIFFVMFPAVTQVVRSHHAVFQTFLDVPLPIIVAMKTSVQRRIAAIAKANEEAEVGIDIGGKGNEIEGDEEDGEDGLKRLLKTGGLARSSTDDTGSDAGGNGSVGLQMALNSAANSAALVDSAGKTTSTRAKRTKKRSYRRAGSDRVLILLRFIWPVLLYMAYFAIMFVYKGSVIRVITQARTEMLWMTQAEIYMNLATIRSRFAAAACDSAYLRDMLDRARSNGAFTEYLIDAVLYGSEERDMRSGIQTGTPAFVDLWMHSGCINNDDWFYSSAECGSFDAGITSKGLLGAFRSFADYSRQLVTQRELSIGASNCQPVRMNDVGSVPYLVNKFGSALLAVGFEASAQFKQSEPLAMLDTFDGLYSTVVALTCCALGVFYVLVYAPLIRHLDKDIKNVRLLLLLFPDEIARSVPAIVAAGRQLLQDAASSAGSVASGTHR